MKSLKHGSIDTAPDGGRVPGNCSPLVKLWRIKRLSLYKINVLKPGGK